MSLRRARLSGANLEEAELEGADLGEAWLEGANLFRARLKGANLHRARLEGANLREARLEGANLEAAQLEGANLHGARLERAYLYTAQLDEALLEGANLYGARLEGADLSGARLEGADLSGADFRNSIWAGASSGASLTRFADFRGAQGLTQAQLEGFIGDDGTLLPDGPSDRGEPWYIWSCWEQPPAEFDRFVAATAGPLVGDAELMAALRAQLLCGPGNPRRKTGTPLALDAPYPEGHPLADRE